MKKPVRLILIIIFGYVSIGLLWNLYGWYSTDKINSRTVCGHRQAAYILRNCTPEHYQDRNSVCSVYKEQCVDNPVHSPLWIFRTLKKSQFYYGVFTWPYYILLYSGAMLGLVRLDY